MGQPVAGLLWPGAGMAPAYANRVCASTVHIARDMLGLRVGSIVPT